MLSGLPRSHEHPWCLLGAFRAPQHLFGLYGFAGRAFGHRAATGIGGGAGFGGAARFVFAGAGLGIAGLNSNGKGYEN